MAKQLSFFVGSHEVERGASISDCGTYRYALTRRWSDADAIVFVGLNPSTADAFNDDPTIRRCMGFAKMWGFGQLIVVNLFAFRSTDPRNLAFASDPIGPENDACIRQQVANAKKIIACWGTGGDFRARDQDVLALITPCYCLGTTKDGFPRHPLYVPRSQAPLKFCTPTLDTSSSSCTLSGVSDPLGGPSVSDDVTERVAKVLRKFLISIGRTCPDFEPDTNLVTKVGLKSDDGIDITLCLGDEFGVSLPLSFNAVVHESGSRGRRLDELVDSIRALLPTTEEGS